MTRTQVANHGLPLIKRSSQNNLEPQERERHCIEAHAMYQLKTAWLKNRQAKPLVYSGLLLVASGIIHSGIYCFYGGPWEGEVSWRKPILFGISAGLTSISMGWVWSSLSQRKYDSFLSCTAALALLIEVGLIDLQQWRGVPSHFNRSTTLDSIIYNAMGLLILWVTGVILMLTIRSFTEPLSQPLPMLIATQYGLIYLTISCLIGIIININGDLRMQHGLPPAQYGDAGVPKFPHGVVIHALQWLPLLAWGASKARFSNTTQLRLILLASRASGLLLIYAAVVTLLGRARFDAPPQIAVIFYIAVTTLFCINAVIVVGLIRRMLPTLQSPQSVDQ